MQSPPKGTQDWTPEEFRVRKHIFDTWRDVCLRYGYQEYLTPLVEHANIYRQKSGEDVGGKELMSFTDQGGRELAIRPEMTPSVTRMVSKTYNTDQKPLRLFSIANFMRGERPQRGRNREFWQLNYDLFGSDSLNADSETIAIAIEIMKSFNPPKDAFTVRINHRGVIDDLLKSIEVTKENQQQVVRILDKHEKLDEETFLRLLKEQSVSDNQLKALKTYLTSNSIESLTKMLPESEHLHELTNIVESLTNQGYGDMISVAPDIIRGFDYYDGMIFEVFDNHPDNNRAMFGGGRYNGLASIFGINSFPSVGCAPGDETTKLFLDSWDLLEKSTLKNELYYLPLLDATLQNETNLLAQKLRSQNKNILSGLDLQKMSKAIEWAQKRNCTHVVIFAENEANENIFKLKNLTSGEESTHTIS